MTKSENEEMLKQKKMKTFPNGHRRHEKKVLRREGKSNW